MNKKAALDPAIATIILLAIAAIVIALVIVWFSGTASNLFGKTKILAESADTSAALCSQRCNTAQNSANPSESAFCKTNDINGQTCNGTGYSCSGIACN